MQSKYNFKNLTFTRGFYQPQNFNPYESQQNFRNYNMNEITYMDVDQLKDELIKIKTDYHQKNKDLHELKTAYRKLDNDYKNNLKFIEKILNETVIITNIIMIIIMK